MNKLNILAKFGGHQHELPKVGTEDVERYDGFICLVKNKEEIVPSIYVLMSSSIKISECYSISYFPSYLKLNLNEEGWDVKGYVQKKSDEVFEESDIKTVY